MPATSTSRFDRYGHRRADRRLNQGGCDTDDTGWHIGQRNFFREENLTEAGGIRNTLEIHNITTGEHNG